MPPDSANPNNRLLDKTPQLHSYLLGTLGISYFALSKPTIDSRVVQQLAKAVPTQRNKDTSPSPGASVPRLQRTGRALSDTSLAMEKFYMIFTLFYVFKRDQAHEQKKKKKTGREKEFLLQTHRSSRPNRGPGWLCQSPKLPASCLRGHFGLLSTTVPFNTGHLLFSMKVGSKRQNQSPPALSWLLVLPAQAHMCSCKELIQAHHNVTHWISCPVHTHAPLTPDDHMPERQEISQNNKPSYFPLSHL